MKTVFSVAVVLSAAGAAQAAFDLAAIDFAADLGTPIVASADFVQSSGAANDIGNTGIVQNGGENSSGLWMSGTGITETPIPGTGFVEVMGGVPDLVANSEGGNDVIIGNTLAGGWLVTPSNDRFEPSGDNGLQGDADGFGSVLVARLSVPSGETIDFANASAGVSITPGGPGDDIVTTVAGFNEPFEDRGSTFQIEAVSLGTNEIEGTSVDTYDIFVNELPTPGTVTLAGLAGLAGLRRRR